MEEAPAARGGRQEREARSGAAAGKGAAGAGSARAEAGAARPLSAKGRCAPHPAPRGDWHRSPPIRQREACRRGGGAGAALRLRPGRVCQAEGLQLPVPAASRPSPPAARGDRGWGKLRQRGLASPGTEDTAPQRESCREDSAGSRLAADCKVTHFRSMIPIELWKTVLIQDHIISVMGPCCESFLRAKRNICLLHLVDDEEKKHLLKWIHANKQCFWEKEMQAGVAQEEKWQSSTVKAVVLRELLQNPLERAMSCTRRSAPAGRGLSYAVQLGCREPPPTLCREQACSSEL
ncbi:uncharacterized protein M8220_003904 [Acridotheres tristis]